MEVEYREVGIAHPAVVLGEGARGGQPLPPSPKPRSPNPIRKM